MTNDPLRQVEDEASEFPMTNQCQISNFCHLDFGFGLTLEIRHLKLVNYLKRIK